jgi:hypothetical protein
MNLSKMMLVSCLAFASLGLSGCAAMRASGARHAHIEKETEGYVYDKPLAAVWPQARQILFAEGYEVKDTDASNAETDWKEDGDYRTRYLISGIAQSETTCKVEFMKADQQKNKDGGWYDPDTERDLGMEWKLIKKVSPDKAKAIEKDADAKGDKARKEG